MKDLVKILFLSIYTDISIYLPNCPPFSLNLFGIIEQLRPIYTFIDTTSTTSSTTSIRRKKITYFTLEAKFGLVF